MKTIKGWTNVKFGKHSQGVFYPSDKELIRQGGKKYFVTYAHDTKMKTFSNKIDAQKFVALVNPYKKLLRMKWGDDKTLKVELFLVANHYLVKIESKINNKIWRKKFTDFTKANKYFDKVYDEF